MSSFTLVLTALYGISGLITFIGFLPTLRDVWKGIPSANLAGYGTWSVTTFVSTLYAVLIVKDFALIVVIGLQFLACVTIFVLRLRIKAPQVAPNK